MYCTTVEEFKKVIDSKSIQLITSDSRRVRPGSVFVAMRGHDRDGHSYIENAKRSGAIALITESFVDCELPTLVVPDIRHKISEVVHALLDFKYPSLTAVTGTNGKSSTTVWIAQCRQSLNVSAATIGTLGVLHLPTETHIDTGLTTPGAVETQSLLARLDRLGTDAVSIEVSSHALDQGRVSDLPFDSAHFTNLTRDHLDYHGSMESYFESKAKLFEWSSLKCRIVNIDDTYGRKLFARYPDALTYGLSENSQFRATNIKYLTSGISFEIHYPDGHLPVSVSVMGQFNVYNLLGVFAQLWFDGIPGPSIVEALEQLQPVSGRMELVHGHDIGVAVDYAHTPDALTQVLKSAAFHTAGRVWCVFGCGGDRDRGKRPEMARAVELSGAYAVLTSDNPRTEDPDRILDDAMAGFEDSDKVTRIKDRAQAIDYAIQSAQPGDIVIVAGKGHEDYIDVNNKKVPWSEFKAIHSSLSKRRGNK